MAQNQLKFGGEVPLNARYGLMSLGGDDEGRTPSG